MTKSPHHFLDLPDIPESTLKAILKHAHELKKQKFNPPQIFKGLSLIMLFDKRSTRTRISFEVAMKQLGGHTIVMTTDEIHLSGAESIQDTGNVLSRYVDGVMIRMSSHETLTKLASHMNISAINGLTDHSHPCQIMADIMTIEEKLGAIEGKKIAWFGDFNNVARTFAQAASIWNFQFVIAGPSIIHPKEAFGKNVSFTTNPYEAAANADVVVTDTWVSMGQEEKITEMFTPFQVNTTLMAKAKKNAIFMHCMPIHRGEEVTNEVLATPSSVVYDEAENRLHVQKAILAWCLESSHVSVK